MKTFQKPNPLRAWLHATVLCGSMIALSPTAHAQAQQRFPSAEAAVEALVDAVAIDDDSALQRILGTRYMRLIHPHVDQDEVYAFLAAWAERHTVAQAGNLAWLDVGKSDWRMPIPVARSGNQWKFDVEAGMREMQQRRLGRNELGAIAALQTLQQAQAAFHRRQGHFATRLVSQPGTQDGLYWPYVAGTDAASPLGPDALAMTPDTPAEAAYSGYRFKILPATGSSEPAIVAWPAQYGVSGVHSFLATQDGTIRQNSAKSAYRESLGQALQWQQLNER